MLASATGDVALAGAPSAAPGDPPLCQEGDEDPSDLRCTGLYRDGVWGGGRRQATRSPNRRTGDARAIADGVREFKPAFELWSDGAQKTRWIYLPPGSKIDASKMNDWIFPVGTKLWKEFRLPISGVERRIETRLLWKTAEDRWTRAVYVWSSDEGRAVQVKAGVKEVFGRSSTICMPFFSESTQEASARGSRGWAGSARRS